MSLAGLSFFFFGWLVNCFFGGFFFRGGGIGWGGVGRRSAGEGRKIEGKAKTIEENFYFSLFGSFY